MLAAMGGRYHAPIGRSGPIGPMAQDWRVRYRGHGRHDCHEAARQFMTQSGALRPSITALRSVYSTISSAMARSVGGISMPKRAAARHPLLDPARDKRGLAG